MSLLPLDPSLARGLLAARDLSCLEQVQGGGGPWGYAWVGACRLPPTWPACLPYCSGCLAAPRGLPDTPSPHFLALHLTSPHAHMQMMTVASMLSPESSVFVGGKGPEQLAAADKEGAAAQQQGGRGGGGAPALSPHGRQLLNDLMQEGLGDHVMLLRLYEVSGLKLKALRSSTSRRVVV